MNILVIFCEYKLLYNFYMYAISVTFQYNCNARFSIQWYKCCALVYRPILSESSKQAAHEQTIVLTTRNIKHS